MVKIKQVAILLAAQETLLQVRGESGVFYNKQLDNNFGADKVEGMFLGLYEPASYSSTNFDGTSATKPSECQTLCEQFLVAQHVYEEQNLDPDYINKGYYANCMAATRLYGGFTPEAGDVTPAEKGYQQLYLCALKQVKYPERSADRQNDPPYYESRKASPNEDITKSDGSGIVETHMYHSWVYTINTAAGSRKGEASVASPAALTIDNIRSLYMVDDLFKTDKQMQDEITLKILSRLLENYQVSSDPTVSLQKLLQGETATNTLGLLASNIAAVDGKVDTVETVAGEAKTAAEQAKSGTETIEASIGAGAAGETLFKNMAAVKADVLTVDEKLVISDEKLDQIKKELPETCPTEKEIEVVFEKAQAKAKAAADAAEQRIKLSLLALAVAVTLN